jgi:hypothetical protein
MPALPQRFPGRLDQPAGHDAGSNQPGVLHQNGMAAAPAPNSSNSSVKLLAWVTV